LAESVDLREKSFANPAPLVFSSVSKVPKIVWIVMLANMQTTRLKQLAETVPLADSHPTPSKPCAKLAESAMLPTTLVTRLVKSAELDSSKVPLEVPFACLALLEPIPSSVLNLNVSHVPWVTTTLQPTPLSASNALLEATKTEELRAPAHYVKQEESPV